MTTTQIAKHQDFLNEISQRDFNFLKLDYIEKIKLKKLDRKSVV